MIGSLTVCLSALLLFDDGSSTRSSGPSEPAPVIRLAEPGGQFFGAGDSRRPRAEVPPMASPGANSTGPSELSAPRSGPRGEEAEGSRDLGDHRPGELYLVPGEHRPGDLDRQGTFRPGDLG